MFVKDYKETTDPRLRSLLQKATRRGYSDIAEKTAVCLNDLGDKTWLRSRVVVITFEECWPMAQYLLLNRSFDSKLVQLLRVTLATKQKDAAGLGSLAYAFSEGDQSMLGAVPSNWALKVVSEGILRPIPFFEWAKTKCVSSTALQIVEVAQTYLSAATWGWDKACIIAGAFLAATNTIPECEVGSKINDKFPYWIALDKHTPQGKEVLHNIAHQFKISYRHLIWTSFYYESAKVNATAYSPWWSSERAWRLQRAGLTTTQSEQLWARIGVVVAEQLEPHAEELRKIIENRREGQLNFSDFFNE